MSHVFNMESIIILAIYKKEDDGDDDEEEEDGDDDDDGVEVFELEVVLALEVAVRHS